MVSNGLKETLEAFDRIKAAPRKAVIPALVASAHELADAQEHLAESSRDTGALINSIAITMPGHTTPAYSQPGGSRVAGETEVIVTAGDKEVRYAHLVEFGTAHSEAQPFFWPAYRLLRKRLQDRINRAAKKAVKDAWKQ
ncbi:MULTISPECIES: HK97-gp10 family putative phage morphogenesis protein [unclassified Rhizobium]|uniref:HK97-gp10 family putative phage morphogenesis protein n=1 Tax=unclassified Rhizobium TaxID=2613769 RepID=UPI001ADBA3A8|nr:MULTISPECIES: HK97-gp10 family putative phage morphogenesis protein [unclassified Rhizobium]MBO9097644.1 HK97 gp10 family phage protein [Rhizobium sp. L58/93]MBO9183839.1 HK97 gp10 family phage protein [Rhizobium sp. E27B/91]QXZ84089.1 HK97 gp10 family phage protein [Rhizobium sp. K1/93]QXZ88398.1 HK97 gp10 family phage protein [Rhizobium sp. K15/93]QYA00983.1 HK97 gp10 family phage protein [Rhizobium sp. B21/90]